MKPILLFAAVFSVLSGCATTLTPEGEKIALISADQRAGCQRLKLVTFQQSLGPNKPANALKGALNEAAAAGADSVYIVSTASHAFDGDSVIAEAYKCRK